MHAWFHRLGRFAFDHRRAVVAVWVVAVALGALGALRLPGALLGGSGAIAGSPSAAVAQTLATRFENPFGELLVVAIASDHLPPADPRRALALHEAARRLRATPDRRQSRHWPDSRQCH
jgi:uncharacterized membrane protein YdfJ with MMPL/SSD domain